MVGKLWIPLRGRKSRSEVVAFAMGLKIGRELAILVGADEAQIIIDRVGAELEDDFS